MASQLFLSSLVSFLEDRALSIMTSLKAIANYKELIS